MKREVFIEKSIKVHGDKYIYTEIPEEVNSRDDVTIICKKHGAFTQNARTHYRGHGCSDCKAEKNKKALLLDTDKFLEKYRSRFQNEYDTSLVIYKDSETDVDLICPKHGIFQRTPHELMRGKGCPTCGRENGHKNKRIPRDVIISRANIIHDSKYIYDKSNWERLSDEVIITCPIHGDFKMKMSKHLLGEGCKECGYENSSKQQRKGEENFIKESKEKFGDKFDYTKLKYINNKIDVTLGCKIHGWFDITPSSHLKSETGCYYCGLELRNEKRRADKEHMIKKAREVHGNKYTYNNFKYINWHTDSYVTCPKHGDFLVNCVNHIGNGSGCPKCKNSKLENMVTTLLDKNDIEYIPQARKQNIEWLGKLTFDFYLPKQNIAIECQGGQHFTIVERFGGEEAFQKTVKHDTCKKELCKENGAKLIYFLDEEYNKYMKEDDIYFNDVNSLIEYIKNVKS